MTKKLAIFVEGQTEQIFVERLVKEVANEADIHLESRSLSDHGIVSLKSLPAALKRYQVVIFNCENDEKVKSVILETRPQLIAKGYSLIVGLRDLYPKSTADLAKVKLGLKYGMPTTPPLTEIHLAVSETEAWFLQDKEHYFKVDPSLDVGTFKADFGFDPESDSAEDIPHASALLKLIYQSVGKTYKKKRFHVERTVNALDFASLCLACGALIPHFEVFSNGLYEFFD